MEFFLSRVKGYNLTKKGFRQGTFMWNLVNVSKQFFAGATFGEKFYFF